MRHNSGQSFQSFDDFNEFQDFDDQDEFFDAEGVEFDQEVLNQV